MAREIMDRGRYEEFMAIGELDFSYSVPGVSRVRVNVFKQRKSTALVMCLLSTDIKSFEELGLPEVLAYLARRPNGLD